MINPYVEPSSNQDDPPVTRSARGADRSSAFRCLPGATTGDSMGKQNGGENEGDWGWLIWVSFFFQSCAIEGIELVES